MPSKKDLSELDERDAYKLPWRDFVEWALHRQLQEEPFNPSDGNLRYGTPAWALARLIKGRMPEATAEYAWRRVSSIVELRLGGWDDWLEKLEEAGWSEILHVDDLQVDFMHSYETCRSPGIGDAVQEAVAKAQASYLSLPDNHGSEGYEWFVSVCGYLAVITGSDKVALPARKLAEALGRRPNTVSGWIKWAVQDGFLALVKKHRFRPGNPQGNRAAVYRVAERVWRPLKPGGGEL